MQELGERTLAGTEHLHDDWELLREYPLSRELLAMSRVWRSPDGSEYVIAAKGAPEAIADLCHLSAEERGARPAASTRWRRRAGGSSAWRGRASGPASELPGGQHDFDFRVPRPPRPLGPGPAGRPGGDRRVPPGRDPRPDDHRRLPRDGAEHRARDRAANAGGRRSPGPSSSGWTTRRSHERVKEVEPLRADGARSRSCASSRP